MSKKLSHIEFLEKLSTNNPYYVRGDFKVISRYQGSDNRILVRDSYGVCDVLASDLSRGRKVTIGHSLDKINYLINRFKETHGDRYDYSLVNWESYTSHVKIICPVHGVFEQITNNHIRGFGCRLCNKNLNTFKLSDWKQMCPGNPGTFYVLRCWNEEEEFYKVGITCNSLKSRYQSKKEMPYNFEIIKEIVDEDRERIWNLEKEWLRLLDWHHYRPLINFCGSARECFKI